MIDSLATSFGQLGSIFSTMAEVYSYVWFLVVPPLVLFLFNYIWLHWRQDVFYSRLDFVLLEMIPPKDIEKSPQLMEAVFSSLGGQITTPNTLETFVDGYFEIGTSFEFASHEGEIHYYRRCPRRIRPALESALYSSYPNIEIFEVLDDYVDKVPTLIPNKDWDLWGTDFALVDDPTLPMRTYSYFEEDVSGNMIDPLGSVFEAMARIGPGQHIWFQYVASPLHEAWNAKEGPKGLKKVLASLDLAKNDSAEGPLEFRLTPGEREKLKAAERNISYNMFATKARFVYLGRREGFTKSHVSSFVGALKQFNDMSLNSFKPDNNSKTYALFLFVKTRVLNRQRKLIKRFRGRSGLGVRCVLSAEELATLYHFPDMSVVVPTMRFVESKRASAPANLPIGDQ